jgi:hypothetical protein
MELRGGNIIVENKSKRGVENAYNEKIQFLQMIIHDLHMTGIVAVEFLRKSRRH